MPVQVKLPTILRKHAGGEPKVSADGVTLRDVLGDLETRYPGITKNVLSEDGGLHRFINVYLNDEDVRYLGSLETEVGGGRHRLDPARRRRRLACRNGRSDAAGIIGA